MAAKLYLTGVWPAMMYAQGVGGLTPSELDKARRDYELDLELRKLELEGKRIDLELKRRSLVATR